MIGIGFQALEEVLREQFKKKGDCRSGRKRWSRAGRLRLCGGSLYGFSESDAQDGESIRDHEREYRDGHGRAAAGVKFYCAYPMSPSTGVLHWMAAHARKAGHHGAPGGGRDWRDQH